MEPEEARPRLAALGFRAEDVEVLALHFLAAEERGLQGHGLARIEWLEGWPDVHPEARPSCVVAEPGYQRWDGGGGLGYLTLNAVVEAQVVDPPSHARVVVCGRTFPTGVLGYWTRRLAAAGLVAALTATSPRRLAHPSGGPPLAGTNPLSIAIPSSDGRPIVVDASMAKANHGDILTGAASSADVVPFGGEQAHKAFALALGLQLLVESLTPNDGDGAVLVVARPENDPVPALRELAAGRRLPGDGRSPLGS